MASIVKVDRKEYYILLIILVFNFLSFTIIIVLLWTLKRKYPTVVGCSTMCVPCSSGTCCGCMVTELSNYVNRINNNVRLEDIESEAHQSGFGKTQKKVSEFMEEPKDKENIQKKQYCTTMKFEPWEINPSALLQGNRSYKENTDEYPFQTVRGWGVGYKDYIRNGIELINGRLFIPEDGLYVVYSHFLFRGNNQNQDYKNMEQKVFRYNIVGRTEEELFSHSHPHTKFVGNNMWIFGSYANSDVKLQAGDLIYVKVSNISKLMQRFSDYFGIYML